jgi:hypothetical protein
MMRSTFRIIEFPKNPPTEKSANDQDRNSRAQQSREMRCRCPWPASEFFGRAVARFTVRKAARFGDCAATLATVMPGSGLTIRRQRMQGQRVFALVHITSREYVLLLLPV